MLSHTNGTRWLRSHPYPRSHPHSPDRALIRYLATDISAWTDNIRGLRLHLVRTPSTLPVASASIGTKADERTILIGMFEKDPGLRAQRPGQVLSAELSADKNHYGRAFEQPPARAGPCLLRSGP